MDQNYLKLHKNFVDILDGTTGFDIKLPGTSYYRGCKARESLMTLLDNIIQRRRKGEEIKDDFIQSMISRDGFPQEERLTDLEIKDNRLGLLLAGHASTGAALMWAIKFLEENSDSKRILMVMYSDLDPDGNLNLHHFIILMAVVMILLSQLPSFHSLRYINSASLFLSLGYSFCIAGYSSESQSKDYSVTGSKIIRIFSGFKAVSIMGTNFGNGILPEIQATLAPPVTGKMFKGLCMCYGVIMATYYSIAVSGYWAFSNNVRDNILENLMPDDEGVAVVPVWLLVIAVIFILLQLFAVALVYCQVAYEILEKKSADVSMGVFSLRNLLPRLFLRSLYIIICAFVAAMLPFFGDINALVGAMGFIPLDFILPMLLYNISFRPDRTSIIFSVNSLIMIIFTGVGIMGTISSVCQIVVDAKLFKLFSTTVID